MIRRAGLPIKLRVVASFALYVGGLLSLFVIDLLISRFGTVEQISQWAYLRSSVMLMAFFALVGADQSLIRNSEEVGSTTIPTVVALAAALGALGSWLLSSMRDDLQFHQIFLFVMAVSISMLVASYYRLEAYLIRSQLSANLWKYLLLIAVLIAYFFHDKVELLNFLLMVSLVVLIFNGVAALGVALKYCRRAHVNSSLKDFYKDGARFLLMGGTLNLSVNIEQVLLAQVREAGAGAEVFSYITSFGAVFVLANGFYGFLLGPYIKKNKAAVLVGFRRFIMTNMLAACVLGFVAIWVGIQLYAYLYQGKFVFRYEVAALTVLIFMLRFLYVVPSSFIGFAGSEVLFNKYLLANIASLLMFVIFFYVLVSVLGDPVLSVLLASLMNWVIRVVYGVFLAQNKEAFKI